jgi:hypothetical protein
MPRTYVENDRRLGCCSCNLYTVALYCFELGTKMNSLPNVKILFLSRYFMLGPVLKSTRVLRILKPGTIIVSCFFCSLIAATVPLLVKPCGTAASNFSQGSIKIVFPQHVCLRGMLCSVYSEQISNLKLGPILQWFIFSKWVHFCVFSRMVSE